MAEHRLMTDAQFAEMEERRNKQFDRIFALLDTLLQRQGLPPISSHGAANSLKEIPNSKQLNVALSSPMQDQSRSSMEQIEVPSVRESNLSLEVVTPTNNFICESVALLTSGTKIIPTKPIESHFVTDEYSVRRLVMDASLLGIPGPPPMREIQVHQIGSQKLTENSDELQGDIVNDGTGRNRGLSLKYQFPFAIIVKIETRIREPKIHMRWNDLLIERKVVSMPVYGKIKVHKTEIAHDSRLIPPDKLLQIMLHRAHPYSQINYFAKSHFLNSVHQVFAKMLAQSFLSWIALILDFVARVIGWNRKQVQLTHYIVHGPLLIDVAMHVLHDIQLESAIVKANMVRREKALEILEKCLESKEMSYVLNHYDIPLIGIMVSDVDLIYLGGAKGSSLVHDIKAFPLIFGVPSSLINDIIFEHVIKYSSLDLLVDFFSVCGSYVLLESLEILGPTQSLAWHVNNKIAVGIARGLTYPYCGWVFPIVEQEITATVTAIFTSFAYAYFVSMFGLLAHVFEPVVEPSVVIQCVLKSFVDEFVGWLGSKSFNIGDLRLVGVDWFTVNLYEVAFLIELFYSFASSISTHKIGLWKEANELSLQFILVGPVYYTLVMEICHTYRIIEAFHWVHTMVEDGVDSHVNYSNCIRFPYAMGNMDLFMVIFTQLLVMGVHNSVSAYTSSITCRLLGAGLGASLGWGIIIHDAIGLKFITSLCVVVIVPLVVAREWYITPTLIRTSKQICFYTTFAALWRLWCTNSPNILVVMVDLMTLMFEFFLRCSHLNMWSLQFHQWDPGGCFSSVYVKCDFDSNLAPFVLN